MSLFYWVMKPIYVYMIGAVFMLLACPFMSGQVDAGTVTITSPTTGTVWEKGETYTISWTSTGVTGSVLDFELWKGESVLFPGLLFNSAPSGSTSIGLPLTGVADGNDYRIRIYDDASGTEGFSGYFTIGDADDPIIPEDGRIIYLAGLILAIVIIAAILIYQFKYKK